MRQNVPMTIEKDLSSAPFYFGGKKKGGKAIMFIYKETAEALLEAIGFSKEEIMTCKYDTRHTPPVRTNEPKICCICGRPIENYGNNPWPVVEDPDEKCCDVCNYTEVIPARLTRLRER